MRFSIFKFSVSILVLFASVNFTQAQITQEYIAEKYAPIVKKIYDAAMADSSFYDRLGYMCDMFGPRLSGSQNLENAIRWAVSEMKKDKLANVRLDSVMVPHWVRGAENCTMTKPWKHNIPITGFGGSVPTPKEGISAEVLVVKDFDELEKYGDRAKGRIVVFDDPWQNYGQAVQYRFRGAIAAAKYGAIASLTRATSPIGMSSPHTGMMVYADTLPKIPSGAIALEDSELLHRIQNRGVTPVIYLKLESETLPDALSWNVLAEMPGKELPDEYIAFGGHIDCWDLGTGAHDDAAGCLSSWASLKLLKDLGLTPKRTLRSVFWVNEENGVRGGKKYFEDHGKEKHALMFEFDSGLFPPSSLRYTGPDSLLQIVKMMQPLLQMIDSINVDSRGGGVDIGPMMRNASIPGMSLSGNDGDDQYFWYHHSANDTFDKIDKTVFNKTVAAIASALYIYADLPIDYFSPIFRK